MADFYMDANTGSNANSGATWTLARATYVSSLSLLSAGDRLFVRANASAVVDTYASSQTFSYPVDKTLPVKIIGVKTGTTAEPPTSSDVCIRGTDTLPVVQVTGAGNDMTTSTDATITMAGMEMDVVDRLNICNQTSLVECIGCRLKFSGRLRVAGGSKAYIVDCEIAHNAGGAFLNPQGNMFIYGGEATFNGNVANYFSVSPLNNLATVEMRGFDLSAWAINNTLFNLSAAASNGQAIISNCRMPTAYTEVNAAFDVPNGQIEIIASNSSTTKPASGSYQDYYRFTNEGMIVNEGTIVRTGGATDGADGTYSIAMTPTANAVSEGSVASLKSPWLHTWLDGGANTLTLYIANSSASTDYNEDEVWVEFYTADSADTAQHDQQYSPALQRLFPSSTPLTDDTGSTWGTGGNNHQTISITVTSGFSGYAYVRLHLAKREASPTTLYLDPKIVVT